LWLITIFGVIVPRRLRADWKQEWLAELQHREISLSDWDRLTWQSKLDLFWRSVGAFKDAILLQPARMEDQMFNDLRYGARMLLKSKGFTAVAVLSLALGIGANTALFTVVDAVLLKTLPVKDPEGLVLFEWQAGRPFRTNGMRGSYIPGPPNTRGASMFRYDFYQKMQAARAQSADSPLIDFFAFGPIYELTSVVNDQAEIVQGQAVSGGYYAGLGVEPILGRTINDSDDQASAPPVVVISHRYWRERFGFNPSVIGQQIIINKNQFTIIGVTPAPFEGTLQVGRRPELTVPIAFEPLLLGERTGMARAGKPDIWWLNLMGRLRPGATREQARDSLNGVFETAALEAMPPPRRETDVATLEPQDYPRLIAQSGSRGLLESRKSYSGTIYGLFLVVAVILLIACANVANLLLARAAMRSSEISVRLAVGAGRGRLIRQLLTESLLLSIIGGVAGVIFALWGKSALLALADKDAEFLPNEVDLTLNLRVLGFTLLVSLLTGVLFGLVPAWRATRLDLTTSLKQGRRATGVVSRLSKGLVVAQVALSLLLLIGAGLFIRTLYNLQHVDVGFNQQNLLLFSLQPEQAGYKEERLLQFYHQLFARLDNLPGVRAATVGRVPLIAHYGWNTDILLPGETEKAEGAHLTNRQMVRENYFSALEIPLLVGREFNSQDDKRSTQVGIVNQAFWHKFFPDEEVLGKHVRDTDGKREIEIVGVVRDTKYSSQREEMEPLLYTPWRQELEAIGEMYFTLRTTGDPTALAAPVRQIVHELDSNLPVTQVGTQVARSKQTFGQERLYARLLSFFAALALLLAAIGLSGVLAYSVAQRTNEIGIRMALGALPGRVLRLVIWQGMKLVVVGLIAGAVAGYGIKRLMQSQYFDERAWQRGMAQQLYGVSGTEPVTIITIAVILATVALVACWLPARKAAQVDPLTALRHE
jgi:predicted permease